MNSRDAIKLSLDSGDMVAMAYLEDLTDADLLRRPAAGCNNINWQVGHLVAAENSLLEKMLPGSMPPLPSGFAEKYTPETATNDNPAQFFKKDELLKHYRAQRTATLAALAKLSDADLDRPTELPYCPTLGSLISLQGSHWLMHAGQWVVVRRQLGRKPLF